MRSFVWTVNAQATVSAHERRSRVVVTVIAVALAGGVLLAGGGYAVGWNAFDQLVSGDPNGPKRIGERGEVAATDDATVYAWNSTRGICMGISIHDQPIGISCGTPPQPPHQQVVGLDITSPGGGDTSTYVIGPTAPSVARVSVVVRDGREYETETIAAPDELDTRLRFYAVQIPNAQPTQTAPGERVMGPVTAVRAYDAAGVKLGSLTVG